MGGKNALHDTAIGLDCTKIEWPSDFSVEAECKEPALTQVQVAELLGISQQLMAAYEAAQLNIPAVMIPKLAALFEISWEEMLDTEEPTAKWGPMSGLFKNEKLRPLSASAKRVTQK